MTTPPSTPAGTGPSPEGPERTETVSEPSIAERVTEVVERPAGRSVDEYHADFVAAHVQAKPESLPEGAAEEVDAVVAHLHAVADVLEVIETVEAEGRVATEAEVAALEVPRATIESADFNDPDDGQSLTRHAISDQVE